MSGTQGCAQVKRALDLMAIHLCKFPRHRAELEHTRLRFKSGITSLKNTTAAEQTQTAIVLLMVLRTRMGMEQFDGPSHGEHRKYNDQIECLELVLCYLAWTKREDHWCAHDLESPRETKKAIRIMMKKIQRLVPRQSSNQGWHLTKLHETLHVVDDILRFGSLMNTNTGPQEHNHIFNAKQPAKTAKSAGEDFTEVLANRLIDRYIVETAYRRQRVHQFDQRDFGTYHGDEQGVYPELEKRDCCEFETSMATKVTLTIRVSPEGAYLFHERQHQRAVGITSFADEVLLCIVGCLDLDYGPDGCAVVTLFTEFKFEDTIYRSHPNFRGKGPWRDWVQVCWESTVGRGKQARVVKDWLPSQIQTFVQVGHDVNSADYYAVVWPCRHERPRGSTVLTQRRSMDMCGDKPDYQLVDLRSIGEHVCMFQFCPNSKEVVQLRPKRAWADEFVGYP